ncbi:hypothetical protein CIHG_09753 [Coccidioides immitis H538.4]|uniref:Uncharacterized protein n=1 Tax=Coccidioides immitis H538.4 TaxID=396776 RepID=A0A0J8S3B8_COCIT|nr:hypothetical protein CIHG_09753 [Coccidioides immitis H538.4]
MIAKREKKKKYCQEEITETENEAQQKKKIEFKIRLEAKIIVHGYNYLAAVSVLRERIEKKIRRFLSQLQNLSEDNNSLPASEKVKKDDFEVMMFSDENDEKNNEMEDD